MIGSNPIRKIRRNFSVEEHLENCSHDITTHCYASGEDLFLQLGSTSGHSLDFYSNLQVHQGTKNLEVHQSLVAWKKLDLCLVKMFYSNLGEHQGKITSVLLGLRTSSGR